MDDGRRGRRPVGSRSCGVRAVERLARLRSTGPRPADGAGRDSAGRRGGTVGDKRAEAPRTRRSRTSPSPVDGRPTRRGGRRPGRHRPATVAGHDVRRRRADAGPRAAVGPDARALPRDRLRARRPRARQPRHRRGDSHLHRPGRRAPGRQPGRGRRLRAARMDAAGWSLGPRPPGRGGVPGRLRPRGPRRSGGGRDGCPGSHPGVVRATPHHPGGPGLAGLGSVAPREDHRARGGYRSHAR